tara:strand:+ start:44070 stop:44363 length:294 start_codon:yes stop_codon:yes gene_type:complete
MAKNPYYDENLEDDCREYMLLSMKLWMQFIEKHPEMVPSHSVISVNNVLDILEDPSLLSTHDVAVLYESFVDMFSQYPDTLEKVHKIPLLFLVPETN